VRVNAERETPYSPQQRTALVFAGTGTAGAYHAGVLRALAEAGVKVDLVAGRGIGAVAAFFAAVDAGSRLWEPTGLWRGQPGPARLYPWRAIWRVAALCLALAILVLALPLGALLVLAVVYLPAFLLELVAPSLAGVLTARLVEGSMWLTRSETVTVLVARACAAAVLAFVTALLVALVADVRHARRRARGPVWWRALGAPLSARPAVDWALDGFWSFIHGATRLPRPDPVDLGRRYAELLGENLTQPGYRELLIAAHDLDTRRDLIFGLVGPESRARLFPPAHAADDHRRAEVVDLSGEGGAHVMDAIAAALSVPLLTEPHLIPFATTSYWRGETHRVCDRPAAVIRLLEEVSAVGIEQVILVTSDVALARPHGLGARLVDPRARLAEFLAGAEASAARDGLTALFDRFSGVFQVQPTHNALGLFDFSGSYDERSDRRQTIAELVDLGYEDAYRQFIEPVVGASGDELERREAARPQSSSTLPPPSTPSTPSISEMLANLE
jgi:hypothetical protein